MVQNYRLHIEKLIKPATTNPRITVIPLVLKPKAPKTWPRSSSAKGAFDFFVRKGMGERERDRETKIDWWFGLVSGLARWPSGILFYRWCCRDDSGYYFGRTLAMRSSFECESGLRMWDETINSFLPLGSFAWSRKVWESWGPMIRMAWKNVRSLRFCFFWLSTTRWQKNGLLKKTHNLYQQKQKGNM